MLGDVSARRDFEQPGAAKTRETECAPNRAENGKEKGPLASKRPKSREETPKEGGGTRRKSRTALQ
jgi:hypothetical protein